MTDGAERDLVSRDEALLLPRRSDKSHGRYWWIVDPSGWAVETADATIGRTASLEDAQAFVRELNRVSTLADVIHDVYASREPW